MCCAAHSLLTKDDDLPGLHGNKQAEQPTSALDSGGGRLCNALLPGQQVPSLWRARSLPHRHVRRKGEREVAG